MKLELKALRVAHELIYQKLSLERSQNCNTHQFLSCNQILPQRSTFAPQGSSVKHTQFSSNPGVGVGSLEDVSGTPVLILKLPGL